MVVVAVVDAVVMAADVALVPAVAPAPRAPLLWVRPYNIQLNLV